MASWDDTRHRSTQSLGADFSITTKGALWGRALWSLQMYSQPTVLIELKNWAEWSWSYTPVRTIALGQNYIVMYNLPINWTFRCTIYFVKRRSTMQIVRWKIHDLGSGKHMRIWYPSRDFGYITVIVDLLWCTVIEKFRECEWILSYGLKVCMYTDVWWGIRWVMKDGEGTDDWCMDWG